MTYLIANYVLLECFSLIQYLHNSLALTQTNIVCSSFMSVCVCVCVILQAAGRADCYVVGTQRSELGRLVVIRLQLGVTYKTHTNSLLPASTHSYIALNYVHCERVCLVNEYQNLSFWLVYFTEKTKRVHTCKSVRCTGGENAQMFQLSLLQQ